MKDLFVAVMTDIMGGPIILILLFLILRGWMLVFSQEKYVEENNDDVFDNIDDDVLRL